MTFKVIDTKTGKEPTTENNLRVDCVSRQAVIDMTGLSEWFDSSDSYNEFVIALSELPSVTPQEPILDKIRAEIEETQTYDGIYIDRAYVLEIIDKYKAESEVKE